MHTCLFDLGCKITCKIDWMNSKWIENRKFTLQAAFHTKPDSYNYMTVAEIWFSVEQVILPLHKRTLTTAPSVCQKHEAPLPPCLKLQLREELCTVQLSPPVRSLTVLEKNRRSRKRLNTTPEDFDNV